MNYETARDYIPAKRRWVRFRSGVYLQRFRGTIRIRYGYRYRHTRLLAVWYPNNRFRLRTDNYYSWSMRKLINDFLPDDYEMCSHRYHEFLYRTGDGSEPRAFYIPRPNGVPDYYHERNQMPVWTWIIKGKVKPKLGPTLESIRLRLKREDYVRDKPRRRGRYWRMRARGVYRKRCGKTYAGGCQWQRKWPRPVTAWKGECGCEVYTKKWVSHDTVSDIMAEPNATVRTAKIQIYGIDKFFTDAKAKTINKEEGYELLELQTGRAERDPDRRGREQITENLVLTAVRMVCSTTGKVYVSTVPPTLRTVRAAMDWMYNTRDYLGRVGRQT